MKPLRIIKVGCGQAYHDIQKVIDDINATFDDDKNHETFHAERIKAIEDLEKVQLLLSEPLTKGG